MDPLLKLLEEHALRTPADLSKMLNLPADEVQRRIKQYEDDKVILGYKAVINDDKVDTDLVKAVIEVKIQPEREGGFDRIAKRIAKFDEVTGLLHAAQPWIGAGHSAHEYDVVIEDIGPGQVPGRL